MLHKALNYAISHIGFYFALFVLVWLVAWAANGLYKTGFDLNKLEELGKFILGKYGTDSLVNTKLGSKEGKDVTQG